MFTGELHHERTVERYADKWTFESFDHVTDTMSTIKTLALTFHQLPVSESQPSLLSCQGSVSPLTVGKLCH